ncbi:TetR/AcrR family transcriptional regulator [Acinetobacter sp. VNH17]|jgi:AcrR family transcriptional regulator|uniref:TetR/AcrR family transcriptional regulator n=1 Tax=Acinetobacter thutiue TaxID=2998078 RepID=A0ABT7WU08_9GAMM|nr:MULTISPECIES: TetR/AcrR family transcriptional regulator [Acinetobacter]MCY6414009.1 TetR/AcrR family transcriptional regulator [Acinetobacter thutiue]MDH0033089.1 TetR/AcrR family transcriptional regulator [Acinetobacter sp. GD04021]MDH0888446.1 TetR/AcrR family transcriptional regulator [Acinetobacter sp. GD03873]MDH1084843.1 TetR/AcrR family transcriptional regulator [Acinetobacter sp. GD03983]MDH2191733.1 TetR/AcrR family transcriptional regulator [Acinetobacter sp. GD03645]
MSEAVLSRESARVEVTDRERVLAASARLFREKGFERASVREIARACGILPGSLHYRYRSKDDILVDMMQLAIERTIHGIIEATSMIQDPLKKMKSALHAHLNVLMSGDDMVYVLLFEWRSLHGAAREQMIAERDRYEQYWHAILNELKTQGFIRKDVDVDLLRLIGLGAINWAATWYKDNGKYNLEQIADAIWQMMTRGILNMDFHDEAKNL